MNIITLIPNYYPNQMIPTPLVYYQPNFKQSPLLSLLSQALKASIISYQNALPMQNQTAIDGKTDQYPQKGGKQAEKQACKEGKELQQKKERIQNLQKGNSNEQDVFIIEKSQKQGKDSSAHITNDSELPESQDNRQTKKTRQPSHRIKKHKTKLKKRHPYIKTQNINLLQAADLPKFGIKTNELVNKRQSLFQRRVIVWDQKFKDRRDKREIRMLNF